MRLLTLAALLLMLSGCNAPGPQDVGEPAAPADASPVAGDLLLNAATFQLGLPSGPVTDVSAGLGLDVPVHATHLTVVVEIREGASMGLAASGLPGCEHAYPDPQLPLDPLVYECTAEPGPHTLDFRHGGGRVTFAVQVFARAAP